MFRFRFETNISTGGSIDRNSILMTPPFWVFLALPCNKTTLVSHGKLSLQIWCKIMQIRYHTPPWLVNYNLTIVQLKDISPCRTPFCLRSIIEETMAHPVGCVPIETWYGIYEYFLGVQDKSQEILAWTQDLHQSINRAVSMLYDTMTFDAAQYIYMQLQCNNVNLKETMKDLPMYSSQEILAIYWKIVNNDAASILLHA